MRNKIISIGTTLLGSVYIVHKYNKYRNIEIKNVPIIYDNLKNKKILITGCTSGIGKNVALRCVENGANVILAYRDENKMKSLKDEIANKIKDSNIDCVCNI